MKEKEIKEIFGVSHSTLHDWANKPNHSKRNLSVLLKNMTFEEAKDILRRDKQSNPPTANPQSIEGEAQKSLT